MSVVHFSPNRRDVLVGLSLVAMPGMAAPAWVTPQSGMTVETARGYVFADIHGDGVRRPGCPGLGGVLVSNGCDIAITRADGSYALPVSSGEAVFVIKPAGWTTPSRGGLPQHSYLYQPLGTPAGATSALATISPTGPLPVSIDFPLQPSVEHARFDVLLVADTQPSNLSELAYVRSDVRHAVAAARPTFVLSHGDVIGDDLSLFQHYRRVIADTGLVWHHVPGNHDMNQDAIDARFTLETWKREIGPPAYAFQHAGVTFVLLNNVEHFGRAGSPTARRGYRGLCGARQLAFLSNLLRSLPRDHLVVVSMHIPLSNFEDPRHEADNMLDRGDLLEILARHPNAVSFAGHSHSTEHHYFGRRDGFARSSPHHHHVLTAACGSWWSGPRDTRGVPCSDSRDGTPRGFHVLSVNGNTYTTRFLPSAPSQGAQMRMQFSDPSNQVTADDDGTARRIVVDVFDGGPKTQVTLSFEGSHAPDLAMQHTAMRDPFIVAQFEHHRASFKPWVAPAISSHIWSAPLPAGLPPGTHRVRARLRNEYGVEHVAELSVDA